MKFVTKVFIGAVGVAAGGKLIKDGMENAKAAASRLSFLKGGVDEQ